MNNFTFKSIIICAFATFLNVQYLNAQGDSPVQIWDAHETNQSRFFKTASLCDSLTLTNNAYSETGSLEDSVKADLGTNFAVADWVDLTSIANISSWIQCMNIQEDQVFMVTNNGNYIHSGNRQYYVHYSTDGVPYPSFAVHAQYGGLYLGSWYGLNMNILAKESGIPCDATIVCDSLNLTCNTYPETSSLNDSVILELGTNYTIADWNDLVGVPNLSSWASCKGIQEDHTFMVTYNGSYLHSGNRQYYVHYSTDGVPYPSFAVHAQQGDFYLGSWYGLNLQILAKQKSGIGIEEKEILYTKLFPNPTTGITILEISALSATKGDLIILDVNGRILKQEEILLNNRNSQHEIDLSTLPNGLYIIRLKTKQEVYTQRIKVLK